MISIIVLILICIAIEVLDKTLGDELNPFFYCLILIIAVVLVIVCMRIKTSLPILIAKKHQQSILRKVLKLR